MSHAQYMPELFNPEHFEIAVEQVCDLIESKFSEVDYIAATGISGIVIAGAVAYKTKKNLFIVRKPDDSSHSYLYGQGKKRYSEFADMGKENKTAIIVDDLISSGTTVARVVNELNENKINCIGIILYHEPGYEGGHLGEKDLNFPIYSTDASID